MARDSRKARATTRRRGPTDSPDRLDAGQGIAHHLPSTLGAGRVAQQLQQAFCSPCARFRTGFNCSGAAIPGGPQRGTSDGRLEQVLAWNVPDHGFWPGPDERHRRSGWFGSTTMCPGTGAGRPGPGANATPDSSALRVLLEGREQGFERLDELGHAVRPTIDSAP